MAKVYERNDKKLITGWAMYDWANSVYSLCIATAIFPIYYSGITGGTNGIVHFIGRDYNADALYSYSISFSFLFVAILSPLLAPIADFKGSKLSFMKFFCYMGAMGCAALYFFSEGRIDFGIIFFILATVGFASSLVYYNAYLKEITDESNQDNASAKGFVLGYVGSVLLLIVNLLMVLKPDLFGIADAGGAARISFITVGIWWAGFSQIPFYVLKRFKYHPPVKEKLDEKQKLTVGMILGGYNELREVWNELKQYTRLRNFLIAFFFFNSAVQTVMYLASIFGAEVIFKGDENGSSKLIMVVLIIQLVAIAGAWLFARLSKLYGNVRALSIAIIVWMFICVAAYVVNSQTQFYIVAFAVGMVMGGIQALSRSTYSKLIPPTRDTASYFSFFDATEKIATVTGTAIFGLITEWTGNMRNAALFLILFFVIGFVMLRTIRKEKILLQ